MAKYKYKITVVGLNDVDEGCNEERTLSFNAECHDDLFVLADKIGADDDVLLSRLLGIKLFGEAVLSEREHSPYKEIFPAFGAFMKQFKSRNS